MKDRTTLFKQSICHSGMQAVRQAVVQDKFGSHLNVFILFLSYFITGVRFCIFLSALNKYSL